MTKPVHADTLRYTIEALTATLQEAIGYQIQGEHLAALGTMCLFEDQAADVSAAIRLYRRELQQRRPK